MESKHKHDGREFKYDSAYLMEWITWSICFISLLAPLCFVLTTSNAFIIETESDLLKILYYRQNVFTSKINIGSVIYYYIAYLIGWAYIRLASNEDWNWSSLFKLHNNYKCQLALLANWLVFCLINVPVIFKHP